MAMLGRIWRSLKVRLFVSGNVELAGAFHIGMGSYVSTPTRLRIGCDVYVGKYCSVQCSGEIGNGVLIANNVGIIGRRDHDMKQIGTMIRLARSVSDDARLASDPRNAITIGDDVWIGFGAVVFSGITVGRGAIISAGAVVADDVEPYAIVRGNPAVRVGSRFSPEEIARHEAALANG